MNEIIELYREIHKDKLYPKLSWIENLRSYIPFIVAIIIMGIFRYEILNGKIIYDFLGKSQFLVVSLSIFISIMTMVTFYWSYKRRVEAIVNYPKLDLSNDQKNFYKNKPFEYKNIYEIVRIKLLKEKLIEMFQIQTEEELYKCKNYFEELENAIEKKIKKGFKNVNYFVSMFIALSIFIYTVLAGHYLNELLEVGSLVDNLYEIGGLVYWSYVAIMLLYLISVILHEASLIKINEFFMEKLNDDLKVIRFESALLHIKSDIKESNGQNE